MVEQLTQQLIDFLQGERLVTLITTDKDTGRPAASTVSWLIAKEDGKTIKLALGHKGSSVDNMLNNPLVVLNVIGPESSHEIVGKAEVSDIKSGTMKFRVVTITIESIEENMFYGGKVTTVPAYTKTYDPDLAKKIDNEIYGELKSE
ncbi:pyridoxamine 5'-phosphate oxidase family protein [Alkalihalobacillus sp. BA299]|uniref:pyridoxamine 5'-phosphate oxidase family protein n=1 Tax=Alkalihalobacillus sp. BA299 TaxID=2815938 RepID=UPI001ADA06D7|nr:pyridoxamine 5'-phosphate oxidase family protein [Alkalihalobacillus sp. BA299]